MKKENQLELLASQVKQLTDLPVERAPINIVLNKDRTSVYRALNTGEQPLLAEEAQAIIHFYLGLAQRILSIVQSTELVQNNIRLVAEHEKPGRKLKRKSKPKANEDS